MHKMFSKLLVFLIPMGCIVLMVLTPETSAASLNQPFEYQIESSGTHANLNEVLNSFYGYLFANFIEIQLEHRCRRIHWKNIQLKSIVACVKSVPFVIFFHSYPKFQEIQCVPLTVLLYAKDSVVDIVIRRKFAAAGNRGMITLPKLFNS